EYYCWLHYNGDVLF
nr:immunoglobulin light chain junction region [Macaca mulatta]MOX12209.1 immunoglobulin light chain junction region [Macaca mulatta]